MAQATHRKLVGGLILLGVMLSAMMIWAISNAPVASAQQNQLPPFSQNKVFGLVDAPAEQHLIRFNQNNPSRLLSNRVITGLDEGERLIGIDFRPATGQLYGVGDGGETGIDAGIYIINFRTAAARQVATLTPAEGGENTAPFAALQGDSFGVDFNPTVDRLRVVSDADQNLRINVDTGDTLNDGTLAYNEGDDNDGEDPNIGAVAYGNNVADAETTRLFDIDFGLNILAQQVDANGGVLETIGSLRRNVGPNAGFDIAPGSGAFAVLTPGNGTGDPRLFRVMVGTGNTIDQGRIGTQANPTVDIALPLVRPAQPEPTDG